MSRVRTISIFTLAAGASLAIAACGSEPRLDVQVADRNAATATAPAPSQAAPEPATGAPAAAPGGGAPMAPAHAAQPPLPAGHPPLDAAAPALPPVDPRLGQGAQALAWTAPAGWVAEPPSNNMRRAQYKVPGPGGVAECVVFYFGPGQGGDPMSNAERWASQFVGADGQPVAGGARTRELAVGPSRILIVETTGTYMAGSMMGGPGEARPGYALLGAVAPGPDANWFFKMTGPEATVKAQTAAFEGLLRSLRSGG